MTQEDKQKTTREPVKLEDKTCPFMSSRLLGAPAIQGPDLMQQVGPVRMLCEKEECAFWNVNQEICAIPSIAASLTTLGNL